MRHIQSKKFFASDPFILPTQGKFSSTFGAKRTYNGETQWQHVGLDIANIKGTPIVAPNSGKVVLIESLKEHGNTIIIDHGFGVLSVFNHMSKINVAKNQVVSKGDSIGEIGDTGIATGPHLHWGLSVQNVRVDPLFWINHTELYE